MNTHTSRRFTYIVFLIVLVSNTWSSCKPLAAAEVEAARKSEESLCKAIVDCYRRHDLDAFAQLAMSPRQIKEMMSQMDLPDDARRETIQNKHAFVTHMQDSLDHVLKLAGVGWESAQLDRFVPTRKPIEMATGYHYCLGQLRVKVGDKALSQPITLVKLQDGQFFVGDFGPFEESK